MDNYADMIEELDEIKERLEDISLANSEIMAKCTAQDVLIDETIGEIEKTRERCVMLDAAEEGEE